MSEVFYDECQQDITDAYHQYHFSICDDGDFVLYQDCVDSGARCGGASHYISKRLVEDDEIIDTNDRLGPRQTRSTTSWRSNGYRQVLRSVFNDVACPRSGQILVLWSEL